VYTYCEHRNTVKTKNDSAFTIFTYRTGGIRIKNQFTLAVSAVLTAFMLSGCTIVSSVEAYLKPPKLSKQHEQIYNALINTETSKINLKYPKSGTYLSAFVVADIDNEPTEEAIVFYEKNNITGSDLSTLRVNFLDQKDGRWESVYDFAAEGSEVERVFISTLGSSDVTSVIIGSGNQTEKNVQLFSYSEEKGAEVQSLGTYSVMDVTDIDGDSLNELIMINCNPEGNTAQLKWLNSSNTLVSGPVLTLSENTTDIMQLIYSNLSENKKAVYLDSYINTNTIITEILESDTQDGTIVLRNVTADNADSEAINRTIRNSSLISRDIDEDGVIEIPINTVFMGYEDKPETEQINMTNWYALENNMLVRKYSSYYSINDGYAFLFPESWEDKVTVKSVNDDIIFCRYDDNPDNQTELMRLCVTGSEEADEIERKKDYAEYVKASSFGDTTYLACLPHTNSPLLLTSTEIKPYLRIIQ